MDIDFYIEDFVYVEEQPRDEKGLWDTVTKTTRRYLVYPNVRVFLGNGKMKQLYKCTDEELEICTLIPVCGSSGWVNNYFLVYDIRKSFKGKDLFCNGLKIDKPKKLNLYLERLFFIKSTPLHANISWKSGKYTSQKRIFLYEKGGYEYYDQYSESNTNALTNFQKKKYYEVQQEKGRVNSKDKYKYIDKFDEIKEALAFDGKIHPKNIHWGQMKLFISELQFLMLYPDVEIIVYAGAAGGRHIPVLSALFPTKLFVLFDPGNFEILPSKNIIIRNEFFTEETVKEFSGGKTSNFLFVTDIRSTRNPDKFKFEESIYEDMERQKNWIKDMKPVASLIKFRLTFPLDFPKSSPLYQIGKTKKQTYLDGELILQAFEKEVSTEMRLLVDGKNIRDKVYDIEEIEQKLFFFNTKFRPSTFWEAHPFWGKNYDTLKFYEVTKEWVLKFVPDAQTNQEKLIKVFDILAYFESYVYREFKERLSTFLLQ